ADKLHDLDLGLVHARHVRELDLDSRIVVEHLGLALAEAKHAARAAAHVAGLARDPDEQTNEQDGGSKRHQEAGCHTLAGVADRYPLGSRDPELLLGLV